MRPLLDTHIWLWWMGGEPHLSKREMASLDGLPAEQRPFICDISLWEVAVLLELGRWKVAIPFEAWLKAACHPRTVEILGGFARSSEFLWHLFHKPFQVSLEFAVRSLPFAV